MTLRSSLTWSFLRTLLVDLFLYLTVLGFLLAIYKNVIPPAPGHFNCEDPTISLPYKGDTFTTKILIAIVFATFLVLVSLTEFSRVFPSNINLTAAKTSAKNTARIFIIFFLSLTWNVCINLVVKTLSAVPRPHFLSTCDPDWAVINCSQYKGNVGYNISQCRVKTEDQDEVFDAMKSFPSGHAQIACFTATFLIVYLQLRLHSSHSLLLRFWLQLGLVIMAATSSISRITDNRHHPADVWVGAIIGIMVALVGAAQMADSEQCEASSIHQSEQSSDQKKEKKEKRPSKIRLLSSSLGLSSGGPGTVVTESEVKDVNPEPAC